MRLLAIGAAGLSGAVAFAAALQGTITRDDWIRAEPVATGSAVARIRTGTTVTVRERSGFWKRVESPAGNGWLKISSVREASGQTAGAGLAALATGRGATGNVVTTSGTRGISAEELTAATPDEAELKQVESLVVTAAAAGEFAAGAGLAPRAIAYLPAASRDQGAATTDQDSNR